MAFFFMEFSLIDGGHGIKNIRRKAHKISHIKKTEFRKKTNIYIYNERIYVSIFSNFGEAAKEFSSGAQNIHLNN